MEVSKKDNVSFPFIVDENKRANKGSETVLTQQKSKDSHKPITYVSSANIGETLDIVG